MGNVSGSTDKQIERKLDILTCHRGRTTWDQTEEKENSLAAFAEAWNLGYTNCECDVYIHPDIDSAIALVVQHDPVFKPLIKSLDLLDALHWAKSHSSDFPKKLVVEVKMTTFPSFERSDEKEEGRSLAEERQLAIKVLDTIATFRTDLRRHIAAVISFDREFVHLLYEKQKNTSYAFEPTAPTGPTGPVGRTGSTAPTGPTGNTGRA
jgi:glycerophosphoryl diester phosphodiesterase